MCIFNDFMSIQQSVFLKFENGLKISLLDSPMTNSSSLTHIDIYKQNI